MSDRPEPLFLARETYRRRRLMDAARFLPFLGIFFFIVPALWADAAGTAGGKYYIFVAWIVLICLAFLLSRRLSSAGEVEEPADERRDAERGGPG